MEAQFIVKRSKIIIANEFAFDGINSVNIGDYLKYEREPNNEFDENAVMMNLQDDEPLGHVKRTLSEVIAPLIDNGSIRLKAVVTDITERTGGYSVLVRLTIISINLTRNERVSLCNRIQNLEDQRLV